MIRLYTKWPNTEREDNKTIFLRIKRKARIGALKQRMTGSLKKPKQAQRRCHGCCVECIRDIQRGKRFNPRRSLIIRYEEGNT